MVPSDAETGLVRSLSLLLAFGIAMPVAAHAQDPFHSIPQDVLYEDELDVFAGLEYDTGALPAGSPVAVRFYIASEGGYRAEIEGVSDLWWPTPLTHQILGLPQGGWVGLDTDIQIAAEVIIDLSAIGMGVETLEIWSDGLYLTEETRFDGLLLPDSTPASVSLSSDGAVIGPFEYSQTIFTGVDLNFRAHAVPRARAEVVGQRIVVGSKFYDSVADVGAFPVDPYDPGVLDESSSYFALLDAGLDIVVVPAVDVCIAIIGCMELASFEIPIALTDVDEEREFFPIEIVHPLPALVPPMGSHDFGEIDLDDVANLEVPLENVGEMELEGLVEIVGSEDFTVFPGYFYAGPGHEDGVMVTYRPTDLEADSATLVITSNDPLRPVLQIPLLGNGFEESEVVEEDTGDTGGEAHVRVGTCGCGTGTPLGAAWAFALAGLAGLRRKR